METSDIVELQETINSTDLKTLWVFGYGSLCWRPGFKFDKAVAGSVPGYSRKFWQGNSTHRGTENKPGRVATLIEDKKSNVFGIAFQINGDAAIPYLSKRECSLGGYDTRLTTFIPHGTKSSPFTVLLYIATPKNSLWLGDAPLPEIASQITDSRGDSGHNVEYLLRLANFMRQHFPREQDDHLFMLEDLVKDNVKVRKLCLKSLMGDGTNCTKFIRSDCSGSAADEQEQEQEPERTDSFQFIARVPEKALRCLNI